MIDAKPLTTADVHKLEHVSDEDGVNYDLVEVDKEDLLATTRALETAQTAVTIATSRAAEEDARAEKAERARDEAIRDRECGQNFECRHWEQRNRELVLDRDAARGNYENMHQHAVDLHALADKSVGERDAALALVSELVTALEGFVNDWNCVNIGIVAVDLIESARAALAKANGGAT